MRGQKRFVHVLKAASPSAEFYVGLTSDVNSRLLAHNSGDCTHTASRRPWDLHVVIEFRDEQTATRFERYLKSGSGRAFARHHFAHA
jgi:putative endonuclease